MNEYKYARELESNILEEDDVIQFSGGFIGKVRHNSCGWWLSFPEYYNREIFKHIYGASDDHEELVELTEELGGDPVPGEVGDFPYQKTAEGLTKIVINLFLRQEQNKFDKFDFNRFHPRNKLKEAPPDLIRKLCLNQIKQGNKFDPKVFDEDLRAAKATEGMSWKLSAEGYKYWEGIVSALEREMEKPNSVYDKQDSSLILLTAKKRKSVLQTL